MSQHVTELIIERSPEDLKADRQVAAFLAYAAKRDPAFAFRLTTAQSPIGQALLRHYGLDTEGVEPRLA